MPVPGKPVDAFSLTLLTCATALRKISRPHAARFRRGRAPGPSVPRGNRRRPMTRTRLALLTGAAVLVLGVLFAATSLRAAAPADPLNPGIPTAPKGPDLSQPIHFSHKIHAGQLGMDCVYCPTNVD